MYSNPNVFAHMPLKDNANDILNSSFNGSNVGATFANDGTYYYAYGVNGNQSGRIDLPTALWNEIGAKTNYTAQMKIRRIDETTRIYALINASLVNDTTGMQYKLQQTNNTLYVSTSTGQAAVGIPTLTGGWDVVSYEYIAATGQVKTYFNGTLKSTTASANYFATPRTLQVFGLFRSPYADQGAYIQMRDVIWTSDVMGGVEITVLPDICYVPNMDCADFNPASIGGEI